MTKLQKYLIAILGLQIVLILVIFLLQKPVAASDNLIFPDLKIENVSEINISDTSGNVVSLQKKGNEWVLPLQDDYPVKEETIQQLVDNLALIRDNRLITRSESSHERLSIADDNFVRKVEITVNGKKSSLYFGSSPATSNIHFRLDGKAEVYLTNAINTSQISSAISSWVDTLIYQIPSNAAKSITVSNPQGEFVFEADAEGNWSANNLEEGFQFDQSKWSSLQTAFTTLRFLEPVTRIMQPEFGLDDPETILKIEYTDEQENTINSELLIGNSDDVGNYFVKWSESDYVFKVSSYNAERITNMTAEDYSSPVPTETPEAETSN